ncbi:hypothetical protein [Bdellovibrio sp. HCB337]|uniref:hypothetical protein n=1 Tax=Bdellovibrio sp. HCB337 TaxID=3394358 RepID=UPI0039A56C04
MKKLMVGFGIAILVVSFQNCQRSGFNVTDASSNNGSGNASADASGVETPGNDVLFKLEPALAIRGMGCIQCHAKVESNILTDFGYQGNGAGKDYFFSQAPEQKWWNSGGIYGDHGNNFNTMEFPNPQSAIVPKAALPSNLVSATGQATLGNYIRSQFAKSTFAGTKATQVYEKSRVYIGAPTEGDLIAAFALAPNERMKYIKDKPDSVEIAGLQDRGTFFQNSSVLNCDGDVVIRGPLLLQNLQVNTRNGCRLHVIGSVFTYGTITYTSSDDNRNLQITSTKSIAMGLGATNVGVTSCDPTSQYTTEVNSPSFAAGSSLLTRYRDMWTVPSFYVRQSTDPLAFGKSVVAEAQLIEAATGTLYDASCRGEGRSISFERLVLNAPIVHSRYQGNVSGTIIAEFALMSLGVFKFKFDPVFIRVQLFPRLSKKIYLDVVD